MDKKCGKQSVRFSSPISVVSTASTVGPKEGEGPLKNYFDVVLSDLLAGEQTWEKAESIMIKNTMQLAMKKASIKPEQVDYVIAGDLLNQSISTTFGIKKFNIPFFGVYGACSTFGESLTLGAMVIDGGFADIVLAGAASHFCASERQFRLPLELGAQRAPTASWTVTGDGVAVLSRCGNGPFITGATTGKIVDLGIKDVNNMGSAMVPAAVDTLINHFKDFNCTPSDYDVIATGDLGHIGHELVIKMMKAEGFDMSQNYTDCGIEIYDRQTQDTHAGGSGCGCSAVAFSGYFYEQLKKGAIKKMLLVPTGALLSTTSAQQGQNIPGIAHAVIIEAGG